MVGWYTARQGGPGRLPVNETHQNTSANLSFPVTPRPKPDESRPLELNVVKINLLAIQPIEAFIIERCRTRASEDTDI